MQNKFLGKSGALIIFRIKMQLDDDSMNLSHAEYLCRSVQTSSPWHFDAERRPY